jgi:uncharacterized protein (TIGR03437 family)
MKLGLLAYAISWAALGGLALGQPSIGGVTNNYSYIYQGLPNYGIAQGSIFVIFGTGLASAPSGLQSPPLKQSLDGASVQVTVNGTTTQALLYYVSPSQIAGILPSNTPPGAGIVTVTLSGQASTGAPITVVSGAFGVLSRDQSGFGPAAAFDANANFLAADNSANPGDTITLWGSGLGPISGDESIPQPQSLASIPIGIDIGGQSATVTFHGRSQYPGLDQINVTIPSGSAGCFVAVVVRIGDLVSNSTTIPIASAGRNCSDPGFGPVQVLSGPGVYKMGAFNLDQETYYNPHPVRNELALEVRDYGGGGFSQISLPPNSSRQFGYSSASPSPGSCIIAPYPWGSVPYVPPAGTSVKLDAGPVLNFDLLNVKETAGTGTSSTLFSGPAPPAFIPTNGGALTIDDGSGGAGFGPAVFEFAIPPPLVWTNITSVTTVNRSQGVTLTWSGGDPNGVVLIDGRSYAPSASSGVSLFCAALVSAHEFTVPPSALLAMYPSDVVADFYSTIGLDASTFSLFSGQGLDAGMFSVLAASTAIVAYQ